MPRVRKGKRWTCRSADSAPGLALAGDNTVTRHLYHEAELLHSSQSSSVVYHAFTMDASFSSHKLNSPRGQLHYISAGPANGPLMIFIHGWPGVALCWRTQLLRFSALGYRCVAMDMLGYGQSPAPRDVSEYSCEKLVKDQLLLLSHLNASSAIWIGHDWGCGPLWTLACHYPEHCQAIISICIPYRVLEMGLPEILKHGINREIYPEDEYPYGQWDYQVFYEQSGDKATKEFNDNSALATKLVFSKANPANFKKPALTAGVTKNGSWFTGRGPPDIPLEYTVLDEEMYGILTEALGRNGWHGATAYYLNHKRNQEYNRDENVKNGGVLEMPVLYIDAKYDNVCSIEQTPSLMGPTRRLCKDLEETVVEAAHWANMEKPDECNAYIEAFLKKRDLVPKEGQKL